MKQCREIRFSNGGHLFAASSGIGNVINVYNFYTGEMPSQLQCKGHNGKIRCIDWWDDDMGFTSCAMDGSCYFFDLIKQKEDGNRILDYDVSKKNINFMGVCNVPKQYCKSIVVGTDRKIWVTSTDGQHESAPTKHNISQVQILANAKAFFAGVSEEGKSGAVEIWKYPHEEAKHIEKLNEVQAHDKGIERMRISYDNNFLFTSGKDGCLIIYEIRDRDPRGGLIKRERGEGAIMQFSDEILTEKPEMDEIYSMRDQKQSELQ